MANKVAFLVVAVALAYLSGYLSRSKGYGFWRSFIFSLLLLVIVWVYLMKHLNF